MTDENKAATDTVAVCVRLDRETARKLRIIAAQRMQPMSAVVVELIRGLTPPTLD